MPNQNQARSSYEAVVAKLVLLVSPTVAIGAPEIREANRAYFRSNQERPDESRILCCRKGLSSEPRACQVTPTCCHRVPQTRNPQDKTSEMDEDRINDKPRIARGRRRGRGSMMISRADLCGGKRYRVDVVFQGLVEERFHPAAKSQAPHSLVYYSSSLTTAWALHHGSSSRTRCSTETKRHNRRPLFAHLRCHDMLHLLGGICSHRSHHLSSRTFLPARGCQKLSPAIV
jgi:hypothetical protein